MYIFFELGPKLEKLVPVLIAALNGIRDALATREETLNAIKAATERIDQLDTTNPKG